MFEDPVAGENEKKKCWMCGGVSGQVCDGRIKMRRGARSRGAV